MSGAQWFDATAYERYMGRWSLPVAEAFVPALGIPPCLDWLDAECGIGVFTRLF